VTRTFNVKTVDCADRAGWSIQLGRIGDGFVYNGSPSYTFQPYSNSDAGPKSVSVEVDYGVFSTAKDSWANGFYLKRRTTFSAGTFNASPEPVRKGKPISIKGKIVVADWSAEKYVAGKRTPIKVQFRTPTGSYKTVKTVRTGTDGWVRTTVKASKTGIWRLVFDGNQLAGPAVTSGDSVKVR
jgi:hypothetical protein